MRVRSEEPDDVKVVRAVNESAFESSLEADIVEAISKKDSRAISLVADAGGSILGHILFSPVLLVGLTELHLMGLGPMAVLPTHQRRGIGSALVREGLDRCKAMGCEAVVVLGHADYYPRFGFAPASRYGISCEYDVPDEVFMLLELQPGSLRGIRGKSIYNEAFGSA
jgi:putative acetyltransferase